MENKQYIEGGRVERQDLLAILNPLSPGVLDPGNYPGGVGGESSGPTAIFRLLGLFYAP